jgi:hypothetical protein
MRLDSSLLHDNCNNLYSFGNINIRHLVTVLSRVILLKILAKLFLFIFEFSNFSIF